MIESVNESWPADQRRRPPRPTTMGSQSVGPQLRLGGAAFLAASGVLHVIAFPEHAEAAQYIGILFLLYGAASFILTAGMLFSLSRVWALATLMAGAAIALYVLARTTGLPAYMEHDWIDAMGQFPVGLATVATEAMLVLLYGYSVLAARAGRRFTAPSNSVTARGPLRRKPS